MQQLRTKIESREITIDDLFEYFYGEIASAKSEAIEKFLDGTWKVYE